MPAGPGESLLSTVYADVHYLFRNAPLSQPQQQKFAKGSYVYLYHSPADRRTKIEIANHAGTPDQEAFYGYLEAVQRITHSPRQPTLCTIVLEQARINTQSEWHLTTWDERNEKRWSQKLHTISLYLWTERDATSFVNHLKNIVPHDKLDAGPLPAQGSPAEHRNSMSPVVQQLERTAISNQYPPRAGSATSAQSLPGPPTPASIASAIAPPPAAAPAPAPAPAPMAYNPAAPAAPEPIAHREKTPPPPDGDTGTGLSSAHHHDAMQHQPYQQYANYPQQFGAPSLQSTPQSSYFPGAPQAAILPPPPQQSTSQSPLQSGQQASPPATQYASYPSSSSYGPNVTSPGIHGQAPPTPSAPPAYGTHTPLQSPGLPAPPAQPSNSNPAVQAAQIAGLSYSYNPAQQNPGALGQYSQQGQFTGNVHTQFYRPAEGEAANGHFAHSQQQQQQQQQTAAQQGLGDKYRISERVNQMEKGIGGFLKKLDKKF